MVEILSTAVVSFGLGALVMSTFAVSGNASLIERNNVLQKRINDALDCVTPRAAHIGKKMSRILRGEA